MKTELRRDIKTPGAILMGLGSIVGTGIFVSIAIATQVAGSGIIIAIVKLIKDSLIVSLSYIFVSYRIK